MAFTELYVRSDAAGGGNGTTDTNSGGNGALTWAEMLAYGGSTSLAGKRFNIKAGTYSRTTSADTFTVTAGAATEANPCALRGFNSSAGDLESAGRTNSSQALVTTNFPAITYTTGNLALPAYCVVNQLNLTSAVSNPTVTCNNSNIVRRCKIANTNGATGSSSARAIETGATLTSVIDCDLSCDAQSTGAYTVKLGRGVLHACRISGLTTGCGGINADDYSAIVECQIYDCNVGIYSHGSYVNITGCSFRNISAQYVYLATDGSSLLTNCVAWGSGGSSLWLYNATSAKAVMQDSNAIGNMGAGNTNQGNYDSYNEVTLTADPFTSSSDFRLNSTAGGGTACKGVGLWPYRDIGAVQVQASAGSSSVKLHPGMTGVSIA